MNLDTLEYPRHVHKPSDPGAWVFLVVTTPDECAAAVKDGWSLTPVLRSSEPEAAPAPVPSKKKR